MRGSAALLLFVGPVGAPSRTTGGPAADPGAGAVPTAPTDPAP